MLPAAFVQADPIAPTTIGFDTVSGAVGSYYNGGTDGAGNIGPSLGIVANTANPAAGGVLNGNSNPVFSVPDGFTGGFSVDAINVAVGFAINVYDGENGAGTLLAQQGFSLNGNTTAAVSFTGTARSVVLAKWSGSPNYDNLTFGSTAIGTPVNEPPAVTTGAATAVTSATATLNATINPAGTATTAQFEYGTTPGYGSTASVTLSPNDGTTAQAVSATVSGLAANTLYYYRATAVNGVGTRNGSALTFTTAASPGQALHFDGIDDKVTIPHRAELNSLPLTVECWFKPTASGSGVSSIVNKYVASSGNGWAIHYSGGQVSGWYYAQPDYVNTTLPGVTVSLNTWHHVAMVVETTGSKLYVDGLLASSAVWSGIPTVTTTTQDVTLGEYVGNIFSGKFFPGAIDEVRIWNNARSPAEIQAFKDAEIASMPSCLMAYYKFSQGVADGVNTGVSALPDIANAVADDGTLSNFALNGSTGNWTTGPTLTAATSTYAAVPDINLVGNGNPILDGATATATGNNTDFGSSLVGTGVPKTFTLENTGSSVLTVSALTFSGANPGDYAVSGITLPATVAANGSTTFTVTFTPSAGGARTATVNVVNDDCDESNYDFALTGTGTVNSPPSVVAANPTITVNEGTIAFNGITFSDPEGNAVTLATSLGTVSAGGGASAFAGSDLTTAGKWRTASVVKPNDPDGDNVYGTDGYALWGLNGVETVVNPAYATITRNPSLSLYPGDANYETIDDPANPSGPQKVTGVLYNVPGGAVPTVFYTLTFAQARRVRMGILVDNSYVPAVSPVTLRLRQTAGGTYDSGHVAAGDGTSRNQTVDYYFFDIAAQAGDVFEISGINDVGFVSNGIGGMFLDTAGWTYAALDGPAGPTTVTVTATDSLGASSQTTFTLIVNNVAPTATFSRSAATANENTVTPPGVSFTGQTDPGTTDVNTGLKYSYDFNNDGTWDDGDGTYAGSLTVATKTIPASYFASPAPASLTVKGRILDKDGGSTDYTVSITINRTPGDVTLNPSSIAENNPANATVGTLAAIDPDAGNTHTFTLVSGTGDADNGSFTIAGNALRLTPSADFETKPTYQLRVRATDGGGLFFEKALTVTITDVAENTAPAVARDAATVTVPEGTTAFNSGNFADANGDTVTITASVGTITQSGAGAWTHQLTLTQGGQPVELTLDSQENLYVVNDVQNKLYKYDSSGSLITSWTVAGAPTGVAVDSVNGWLYVALKDGNRIDKFTQSGTLLTSWGSAGSGDGQFSLPVGVAVDAAGDVYVTEYFNHRVQVFSPAGTFLRKWGSLGSGNGQFDNPQGLRVSPGGTLYVADRGNNRVQYFDTAGNFLGKWGSAGSGNGQFSSPAGIGIDPGGNVVVGDIGNNRIQQFTATGTFVDKLGPSTTAGNLALPVGTAFPPSGRSVYIAEYSNGRVVKFATPGSWNWSYTPADGAAGPTTVTITATDNGSPNLSSTTTFTLNVNNVAPTLALTGDATVAHGTPYTLNLGAITDPGTDTVSAFSINWGDGNTENFTGNPASTAKTHTYATLGAKTITVTLTDEDGTFTGGTQSVTVENAAPVAAADGMDRPNTTKVAKVLKSDLLGNDSDADGDPLILTAVGNALPAGATVAMAGNFVVYTAPANNAGNGSFTYTLSDGTHAVTGTVTVTETTASGGGSGTPNYLTLVPSGDDFIVTFLGVPGGSFRVQYSAAGPPNYDWQEFAPPAVYTAAPNGVFTHTDVNPPGPTRFYRAVNNP